MLVVVNSSPNSDLMSHPITGQIEWQNNPTVWSAVTSSSRPRLSSITTKSGRLTKDYEVPMPTVTRIALRHSKGPQMASSKRTKPCCNVSLLHVDFAWHAFCATSGRVESYKLPLPAGLTIRRKQLGASSLTLV